MSKKYVIDENTLTYIANRIREQSYITEEMTPEEMGDYIGNVHVHGEDAGYDTGRAEGIEQGKQEAYDAFWDAYQDYGKRTDNRYFCSYYNFTEETFKPKYPITPSSYVFDQCKINISLIERGVKFNPTPNASVSLGYAFRGSSITEIPTIDVSKGNPLTHAFYNMPYLTKIEKLIVGEKTQFSNSFNLSKALTEIRFEGVIATNIDFSANPLSVDSLLSIINTLKDYSTDTSGTTYTITLGSTNQAKLSADELKQIDDKGWTVQ